MSFKDPGKILSTIEYGDQVERVRSNNRRKVDDGFNGVPPLSANDAAKMGLTINEDFGEMAVLGQQARRQYTNAFQKTTNFFTIKCPSMPMEQRIDWESKLTSFINTPMKDSLEYFELQRSVFACVVSHGIGPSIWWDQEDWLPEMIALEDLRVPTDTKTSLRNLSWFAIRRKYTIEELGRRLDSNAVAGWQKDQIMSILKEYKGQFTELASDLDNQNPERVAALIKQNGGFYQSDASPAIPLWHFYFVDEKGNWFLRVVAARECRGADASKFVFDNGNDPVADSLRKILHVQFGDLNSKAPFLWHSVRSLGFLLRGPCFWQNIFYCRVMAHCMENMNIGFRVNNPQDQGRVQKLEMMNKFVLPQGVQIIPNTERHQIDSNLITTTMAQTKRLQDEASVSFTQDLPTTQGNKEMTATETLARVSQVNAMMSGLLLTAFTYEKFKYKEICRRFCMKGSENKDVRKFQEQCRRAGIPERFINSDLWVVEPEVPLGSGNPTMEMAQAKGIMDVRNLLSPDKQDYATHMYIEAMTGDANLAEFFSPTNTKPVVSESKTMAQLAFGTLMQGIMVDPPNRLNPIDQIETLLDMMAHKISGMLQGGGMASAEDIRGFYTLAEYISTLVARLEQDPNERARVRQYNDLLGQYMNEVKGFEQRLQEQMEAQAQSGGMDPEMQGKIMAMQTLAESQAKMKEAAAAQKMAQQQQKFIGDQERKDAQVAAEINRAALKQKAELAMAPPNTATE